MSVGTESKGILVIGACAKEAQDLMMQLLSEDHSVIAYDNLSRHGFASKDKLPKGVEFIFGDVRDEVMLSRVIKDKNIGIIYNFAHVSADSSFDDFEINFGAKLKLKKICEQTGVVLR